MQKAAQLSWAAFCVRRLGARDVDCGRALLTLGNLKGNRIALLELVEGYALEILRVEEEILRLAFARDESETTIRKRLNCSLHVYYLLFCFSRETTTPFLVLTILSHPPILVQPTRPQSPK